MAITHFTPQLIGRGGGRSVVLAAAYRHCARMDHEAEARTVDYTNKRGMIHEAFLLPAGAPAWVRALVADRSVAGSSEAFWNRVEAFEKRADAQFAKEFIVALPVELSREQNIALVDAFVETQVLARGQVADWVYHDDPGNPHIHLMTTLRPLTEDGFGPKKVTVLGEDGEPLRNAAGKMVYRLWSGDKDEFLEQRRAWLDLQNRHLALAGLDIRVDGRSYAERGLDVAPTSHIGVAAKAIERKGGEEGRGPSLERLRAFEASRIENARHVERRPEIVLDLISREKSVFDERDVAKILHRWIDDAATFQTLLARILQSPQVLRLEAETIDFATGARTPFRYTTRELIRLEAEMATRARHLADAAGYEVKSADRDAVFDRHTRQSSEQKEVSARFRLVFADPEAAFRAAGLDAMSKDTSGAAVTLERLATRPDTFGSLRGKTGLLASKTDREERRRAEVNVPALKRDLDRWLRLRTEAERKHEAEERAIRQRAALDIPALSTEAARVLERVRDAIDRNDLPAVLEFALADRMAKAEIDGFAKAVAERYGERVFLPNGAKEPSGPTFEKLAAGLNPAQREQLVSAWPTMRTAQQLAAQERTAAALKQAETRHRTQKPGQVLQ